MIFRSTTLENCSTAKGNVVVIDVLRAFTTAAVAFSRGAAEIILVGSVEEAFEWRKRLPGSLIMGEVGGFPVRGFDLGNSPSQVAKQDLHGRTLIQRTSAGTQGVILSQNADILLACSFVCATATARYIRKMHGDLVTFVITGVPQGQEPKNTPAGVGDEDAACAEYIQALLQGSSLGSDLYTQRVLASPSGKKFASSTHPDLPREDLEFCTAVDLFDFAMLVSRNPDRYILKKVSC